MAVDPNIKKKADDIRNKVYGKEVRESLASGLEAMSSDVVETVGRQDNVEEQFQDVIENTTDKDVISAPEIISARNGESNLKARLDKEHQEVTAQLAQNEKKMIVSNDFVRRGRINIREDLPELNQNLPFDLYRDFEGNIKHTFDIDRETTTENNLYLSKNGANTTNDGLTPETPKRDFRFVLEKATELNWVEFTINIMDEVTSQDTMNDYVHDLSEFEKVIIKPHGNEVTYFGRSIGDYEWTKDGTSYYTDITALEEVVDLSNLDYRGLPNPLTKTNNKSECDSNPNSYFYNGSRLWVNLIKGEKPVTNKNVHPIRWLQGYNFKLGNTKLIVKDIIMFNRNSQGNIRDCFSVDGTSESELILWNVGVVFGMLNGIATRKVGKVFNFHGTAKLAEYDGFNYHGNGINPYEFVFEYNCHAYDNGLSQTHSCNATTAHDGMSIVRVGSVGYNCHGPVLADVNACNSLNYDCIMYDSTLPNGGPRTTGYWFDEESTDRKGKIVLINCGGGGKDTYTIRHDGIDVFVKNLKGNNVPKEVVLTPLS